MTKRTLFNCLIATLFFAVLVQIFFSLFKIITTTAPDFSVFYMASQDIPLKINPYTDPSLYTVFNYPPVTTLIYAPFTFFPYQVAQGLFVILSSFSVFGIIYLSQKIIFKKFSLQQFFLFSALAFLSFPVKFTLGMGQSNLLALFFLLFSFLLYLKNKSLRAAVCFSLAILLKPFLIFMILFFVMQKSWKTILYAVLFLGLSFVLILPFRGVELTQFYFFEHIPKLFEASGWEIYYNQAVTGFVSRLTENGQKIVTFSHALGILFFLGTLFLIFKRKEKIFQFSLLLIFIVLSNTISWQHHFVFLLFPFLYIFYVLNKEKKVNLLILLFISYILVSWNIKSPGEVEGFLKGIILSHTFFGGTILYMLHTLIL